MKNYRKVQKIINNEFPELMSLEFGCEVVFGTWGMWMQYANTYYCRVVEEQNVSTKVMQDKILKLESKNIGRVKYLKGMKLPKKLKLSICGFQEQGKMYVEEDMYPSNIEVYKDLYTNTYFVDKGDVYKNELNILGQPVTLQSLLRYFDSKFDWKMKAGGVCKILLQKENYWYNLILDLPTPPNEWPGEKWGEILAIIK